jgi:hypothetical protein
MGLCLRPLGVGRYAESRVMIGMSCETRSKNLSPSSKVLADPTQHTLR